MLCLGTLVNTGTVIAGGILGLLLKRVLSERITGTITQGLGLAVAAVGMSGVVGSTFTVAGGKLQSDYILIMIISLAVGGLLGELLKIEERLEGFAAFCERKFTKKSSGEGFARGFVAASLIFCVGSMAILGALEDGIKGDPTILYAKSALDGITALVLSSALGAGVLFSAAAVLLYQGSITLFAVFIAPFLEQGLIDQISLIGSVLIMGIGFNMLKIAKIKTGNLLPALVVPALWRIFTEIFL